MVRRARSVRRSRVVIKLILAGLCDRSARIFALAALAAAAAFATHRAVRGLADAATIALERAADDGALPSLLVRRDGGLEAPALRALADVPAVRAVLPRRLGPATLNGPAGSAAVTLVGVAVAAEGMARPGRRDWLGGGAAAARDGPEIWLDADSAARAGVAAGGRARVAVAERAVDVAVRGVLADGIVGVALVELATARALLGAPAADHAELLLDPRADPTSTARAAAAALPPDAAVQDRRPTRGVGGAGDGLRATWQLAAWLALALAFVALLATAVDQAEARRRAHAVLEAAGAPPTLRLLLAAAPGALLGALAALVGAPVGAALAAAMAPGLVDWVRLQTGVAIAIEAAADPAVATARLTLLGAMTGGTAGVVAAFAHGRARGRGRVDAALAAGAVARRLLAVLLLTAAAFALTGAPSLRGALPARAAGVVALVAAIALAAPLALQAAGALLARRRRAIPALAGGGLRHDGRLRGPAQALAVVLAFAVAICGVEHSLRAALPALADRRWPGDVVMTSLETAFGLAPTNAVTAARLARLPSVRATAPGTAPGTLDVWLHEPAAWPDSRPALLRELPAGTMARAAGEHRARFAGLAGHALDGFDSLLALLLAVALPGAAAFVVLDERRRRSGDEALARCGAGPATRWRLLGTRSLAAGAGVGLVAATFGTVTGLCWTRGSLRHALDWTCDYAVPWSACGVALVLAPIVTCGAAALAAVGRRADRTVTPW
ncbi:MAG: hypothetical protein AB7O97_00420 [Planctomycetota bacterium]